MRPAPACARRVAADAVVTVARATVAVGVLLLAPACVTTPEAVPTDETRCYYFERDAAAEALRLPWGVMLLPEPLEGWPAIQQLPGVRPAVTLVAHEQAASFPFGYWRPLGADSLEIGHPAGGGIVLTLEAEPMRLTGTARELGDAVPPGAAPPGSRPATRVSLVRAQCP
jgi:hypothetical protein